MNFEQGFEKQFDNYCKDNHIMVGWYSNYDKALTTDDIGKVEVFSFCNPFRTIKLPKTKLITLDYIIGRLNKESNFINLSYHLRTLLDKGMNCYPTSYGMFQFYYSAINTFLIEYNFFLTN